jgi:hypothetical protein
LPALFEESGIACEYETQLLMQTSADSSSTHDPAASQGSYENRAWLRAFEINRGRPLRVLHIGNIANNAYNNVKIQRERGIDADVLSLDYCPEWEDAPFSGDVRRDFFLTGGPSTSRDSSAPLVGRRSPRGLCSLPACESSEKTKCQRTLACACAGTVNALLMTALGKNLEAASRHHFVRNAPVERWL